MNLQQILSSVRSALGFQLFSVSGVPVSVWNVLLASVLLLGTFRVSSLVQRAVRLAMTKRSVADEGAVATAQRLVHYIIVIIGAGLALEMVGFDLTAFFAAGAVVAVAFGFAMQNITQNFVSGVILLAERTITSQDILEVDGTIVRVSKMGIRATVARTRDEEELIVPNSVLVQSTVKNYTLEDESYRIRAKVGVSYHSDLEHVRETLLKAAKELEGRSRKFDPVVHLLEFGDSSVLFETSVWIANPWNEQQARSNLNFAIWHALKREGITIPFPQLDLHLDPGVSAKEAAT